MEQEINSKEDLLGRTFEHEWREGKYEGVVYRVEFLSDSELRWTGIKGFPEGRSDTQNYKLREIDQGIFQFSWLADDGLSVSITYNFNKMSAFGVVRKDNELNVLSGLLKVVK